MGQLEMETLPSLPRFLKRFLTESMPQASLFLLQAALEWVYCEGSTSTISLFHDTGKQLGSLCQLLDRATGLDSAPMRFSFSLFSWESVSNIFQV